MKKLVYTILTAAVLAGGILYFFDHNPWSRSTEEPSWRTVEVTRQNIGSSVFALGIIEPKVGAEVRVGSRISGVVDRLHANVGDPVSAGDVIAELDDAELRARLAQSRASLEKVMVDYEQARREYERRRRLFDRQLASQQEYDKAEAAYASVRAQRMEAEANVEMVEIQLSYATIHSPISGVVASVSTQEGETVAAGLAAPTFVNIIDLQRLEVHTYVDETDIGMIEEGQRATFTVDTWPGVEFTGEVTAVYPKAVIEDNVVNYIVTLDILDFKDRILRPEMTANVTIMLEEREDVLTVPTAALRREAGERYVLVAEDGRHERRTIRPGWREGTVTEIIEGLSEGERVIVGDIP